MAGTKGAPLFANLFCPTLATVESAQFEIKTEGLLNGAGPATAEVTGTLRILAEAPVPYMKITVTLKGEVTVKESFYHHVTGAYTASMTLGTNVFLNESIVLKECSTAGSSDELDKGVYNFPFRFQINRENPPTQITREVDINYTLEAHLYKGLPVVYVPFHFAGTFNMDEDSVVSVAKEKKVLFVSEPIRLFLELESSSVRVGQMLKIQVNIENNSGRSLYLNASIRGRPHHNYRYRVTRVHSNLVSQDNREEHVAPHTTVNWEPEGLIVPQTKPTSMDLQVVRVAYLLRVRVGIPLGSDCVVDIPITALP